MPLSLNKTGLKQSRGTIEKRRQTMKQIKDTPEHREKLSKAVKRWWGIRKGILSV